MIIDVIDMTDPDMDDMRQQLRRARCHNPILLWSTCDGIGLMVSEVIRRARSPGTIDLLRLNGHGSPGVMGIASGEEADMDFHFADLSLRNIEQARETLARLKPYFSPNGRVLLLGCNVGRSASGRNFVGMLAGILHVRVTASTGDETSALRPADGSYTAYPKGPPVSGWR